MVAVSGEQYEFSGGGYRAVVTECGAGLRLLEYDGAQIALGYPEDRHAISGRGQLLLPWPNRIEDGCYDFDGESYQLALDEPARRNAIHGLTRWAEWTVAEQEPGRAVLEHTLYPSPGYPFALALRVQYTLAEDGLTVQIEATNVGSRPCPYGGGAHPYLAVEADRVDRVELGVRNEHERRHHLLVGLRGRDREDGDRRHGGMGQDRLLDLP